MSVGDELLAGAHPDLNGPYLASRMADFGRRVERVIVVGDDEEHIASAVDALAAGCGLIFVSGGLGPTLDDVTRHGVARAAGAPLEECPEAVSEIEAWFHTRGARDAGQQPAPGAHAHGGHPRPERLRDGPRLQVLAPPRRDRGRPAWPPSGASGGLRRGGGAVARREPS